MDRGSGKSLARNGSNLTVINIGTVLDLLEANYGSRLYRDTDRGNVVALWSSMFAGENPKDVLTAVKEYMKTESFPPTVADILKIMGKNRKKGNSRPISEVIAEANRLSEASRHPMPDNVRKKYEERVTRFKIPMTKFEVMIVEKREEQKGMNNVQDSLKITQA